MGGGKTEGKEIETERKEPPMTSQSGWLSQPGSLSHLWTFKHVAKRMSMLPPSVWLGVSLTCSQRQAHEECFSLFLSLSRWGEMKDKSENKFSGGEVARSGFEATWFSVSGYLW